MAKRSALWRRAARSAPVEDERQWRRARLLTHTALVVALLAVVWAAQSEGEAAVRLVVPALAVLVPWSAVAWFSSGGARYALIVGAAALNLAAHAVLWWRWERGSRTYDRPG